MFQRYQQSIFQELVEQSRFFSDACRFFSVAKVKQYNFFTSLFFFSAGPAQLFQRCQQSIFQWCQLEQSDYFSGTCWFLHQFDFFFQQCQHSCFRGASCHEPSPWPMTFTPNLHKQPFADAENPSPPLSSSIPTPNTITSGNTKVLLVPQLTKTPSPCPDIASSQ